MQYSMTKISKPLVLAISAAFMTTFTLTVGDIASSGAKGRESDIFNTIECIAGFNNLQASHVNNLYM